MRDIEVVRKSKSFVRVYTNDFLLTQKYFTSHQKRRDYMSEMRMKLEGINSMYFEVSFTYCKTRDRTDESRRYRIKQKLIKLNMLPNDKAKKNMADRNETVLN